MQICGFMGPSWFAAFSLPPSRSPSAMHTRVPFINTVATLVKTNAISRAKVTLAYV